MGLPAAASKPDYVKLLCFAFRRKSLLILSGFPLKAAVEAGEDHIVGILGTGSQPNGAGNGGSYRGFSYAKALFVSAE